MINRLDDKVATSVHQLKQLKGSTVYLLLFDATGVKVEYVAAESLVTIVRYIRNNKLQSKLDITKSMLLRGIVYLAEQLPYELTSDEIAYVVADDYDFVDFMDMETCTEYIEEQLHSLYEDIDNFIVLIGNELTIQMQHKIINKIIRLQKMEAYNG